MGLGSSWCIGIWRSWTTHCCIMLRCWIVACWRRQLLLSRGLASQPIAAPVTPTIAASTKHVVRLVLVSGRGQLRGALDLMRTRVAA